MLLLVRSGKHQKKLLFEKNRIPEIQLSSKRKELALTFSPRSVGVAQICLTIRVLRGRVQHLNPWHELFLDFAAEGVILLIYLETLSIGMGGLDPSQRSHT